MRAGGMLPDDPLVHAAVTTYATDLTLLAAALVPGALAAADTPEVEPQDRAADARERLGRAEHRLGVHGASELGMRVREDDRGTRRSIGFPAFGHIEQGFQTARRSDQISDGWHGRIRRRSAQSVLVG